MIAACDPSTSSRTALKILKLADKKILVTIVQLLSLSDQPLPKPVRHLDKGTTQNKRIVLQRYWRKLRGIIWPLIQHEKTLIANRITKGHVAT